MKRISLIILVLMLTVAIGVACTTGTDDPVGSTETTGGVTSAETTEGASESETDAVTTAPLADDQLYGWFSYGSDLTLRDKFEKGVSASHTVNMVKNEREGLQYILTSDVDYEDLRCEVSALSDGKGNTLTGTVYVAWNEFIYKIGESAVANRGYTPSALLPQDDPFQGGTFDVKAGRSKTLYVVFETDAGTVAGDYTGRLEIKQNGNALLSGSINVKVFDISYDETPDCLTLFGNPTYFSDWEIAGPKGNYGAPTTKGNMELSAKYYEFLLDQWISPYFMPVGDYGVLEENAAKYLNDTRLRLTLLPELQQKDLFLQYDACVENNWLDKISFMIWDEPQSNEHLQTIRGSANRIRFKFETSRFINPLNRDIPSGDLNVIDRLSDLSTLHCASAGLFIDEPHLLESALSLKKERGDTVMWYVCGTQAYNAIDVFPSVPGTYKRILFWQQYLYDIDGLLYYHTTWWSDVTDVLWDEGYEEVNRNKPIPSDFPITGNGVMMFWHPTTKEPVATFSLESMRDGIEDFELIKMAEIVLGKEETMAFVNRITTSLTEFEKDSSVFESVRVDLMTAIVNATKS